MAIDLPAAQSSGSASIKIRHSHTGLQDFITHKKTARICQFRVHGLDLIETRKILLFTPEFRPTSESEI
jgi:hypothetical protein